MNQSLEQLPEVKRGALLFLKERGSSTIPELAKKLSVTREGVRQSLAQMAKDGWVTEEVDRGTAPGRPQHRYRLTAAGEHLFPKAYDALTVELIDRMAECMGEKALKDVLGSMTEARVRQWAPTLKGKSLAAKLKALKGIYIADDPHMDVETKGKEIRLVERNCPFMNVASRRPALCSVTVSTLTRLLGHKVERVESFQAGHGRCVFRLRQDKPVDDSFRFDFEKNL